jgi:hypothetical protein
VEQQQMKVEDLNDQWYKPETWDEMHAQAAELDKLTEAFNEEVGLLARL